MAREVQGVLLVLQHCFLESQGSQGCLVAPVGPGDQGDQGDLVLTFSSLLIRKKSERKMVGRVSA